ncbi:GtrA family protein [Gryllotalpicola protaetiae]|uniref:GtrA family protein n=1 Tax=Gryllotalpicola protaetiae TaxID=2419771 RepID=UPI0013C48B93|nr:GtrA family protein [Gryllotalpicola protaetiae]
MKNLIVALYDRFIRDALKFLVVGGAGFVIDAGVFNLMRVGATGHGHFFQGPIGAKIVSVAVATIVTWVGNRYWTFREHRRQNYLLEFVEFTAISLAGLGLNLLCLWVSHYLLGFTSLLADNISGTLIGTVLAMVFRFVLYRYWVYGHYRKDGLTAVKDREARAATAAIYESESDASHDRFATGSLPVVGDAD